MGIFRRLNTVLRSNLNSLLDRAEEPEKLIAQTVRDMEDQLRQARRELLATMGTAKRLAKKRGELEEEAQGWEDKAVLALREGDESLAREALRRKARALEEAEAATQQSARQQMAAEEMRSALERVEKRIEELKARGGTLAAEVRRAREAPSTEASTPGGSRFGSETFDDLERMGGRIDQLEAEVEAAKALSGDERPEVDHKFRQLEREAGADAVEDELAALKRKLEQ